MVNKTISLSLGNKVNFLVMNGRAISEQIDWSRYRFTPLRVIAACGLLLSIAVAVSFVQFSQSRDNILPAGAPVGGDYVAFYGASVAAKDGKAAMTYDPDAFEQHLLQVGPPREDYKLSWQYPPTYFLLIAPLAFIPFIPGYIAWTGGTAALYFASMKRAGFNNLFLFVILSAPSTFHAVITGQNGFLTASLLIGAALYADKRPILAGLCAALLTVKPQLGVLLPFAYIAGGHWRAFFVAAAGTIALAAIATGTFGVQIWTAFLGGADVVSTRLAENIMPTFKMMTPYAWLSHAGAPFILAACIHTICAIAAIVAVIRVWRLVPDADLRAAMLCACVFFVAPYSYYYEAIILALPVAILAKRGLEDGWLQWEEATIVAMFILPMSMPGQGSRVGLSFGVWCAAIVAIGVIRRIEHQYPGVFLTDWKTFVTLKRPAANTAI